MASRGVRFSLLLAQPAATQGASAARAVSGGVAGDQPAELALFPAAERVVGQHGDVVGQRPALAGGLLDAAQLRRRDCDRLPARRRRRHIARPFARGETRARAAAGILPRIAAAGRGAGGRAAARLCRGPQVVIVVLVAVWPILLNTASATGALSDLLADVGRTLRLGRVGDVAQDCHSRSSAGLSGRYPGAVPLAIIITLLVEMITSLPGIGSLIVLSQRQFRSSEVYGLLVLVGLIGFALNSLFVIIEGMVLQRWPPRAGFAQQS